MKFYLPQLLLDFPCVKIVGIKTFPELRRVFAAGLGRNPLCKSQDGIGRLKELLDELNIEERWVNAGRPYYKVWPSICDALCKITLDVSPALVTYPCDCIAIRFSDADARFSRVKAVLVACGEHENKRPSLILSYGEATKDAQLEGATLRIPLDKSTVEEGVNDAWAHSGPHAEFNENDAMSIRVAIAVALLHRDPSIIVPDVLADDRQRFDESTEPELRQRLIDKARRRGIVGWRIGEQYETIPHYRRPHPALYHVGKGRTEQRIVFRAGSIVHRQKMTEVPTGYLDDDGTEIEE